MRLNFSHATYEGEGGRAGGRAKEGGYCCLVLTQWARAGLCMVTEATLRMTNLRKVGGVGCCSQRGREGGGGVQAGAWRLICWGPYGLCVTAELWAALAQDGRALQPQGRAARHPGEEEEGST